MKTPAKKKKKGTLREYAESLIIAFVIAFFVRSFFIQAFKIPSSSMEPTLLVGDHILVNRLSYVVKVPILDKIIFEISRPERGDVVVFRYPLDRSKDFIKRVIAKGGDTLEIQGNRIYINGKRMEDPWGYYEYETRPFPEKEHIGPLKVPEDAYFVMGDNRDKSYDSRFWGFIRQEDLVGKALVIYFSWDRHARSIPRYVRWERIGKLIK
jgi:signal peptidase I